MLTEEDIRRLMAIAGLDQFSINIISVVNDGLRRGQTPEESISGTPNATWGGLTQAQLLERWRALEQSLEEMDRMEVEEAIQDPMEVDEPAIIIGDDVGVIVEPALFQQGIVAFAAWPGFQAQPTGEVAAPRAPAPKTAPLSAKFKSQKRKSRLNFNVYRRWAHQFKQNAHRVMLAAHRRRNRRAERRQRQ